MEKFTRTETIDVLNEVQKRVHENAKNHGWWPDKGNEKINIGEKLALIHSEVSEALEAAKKPEMQLDEHCPSFTNFAIELADTTIRILDLCGAMNISLGAAVLAKHEFNKTRPMKHGGKKF